MEKDILSKVRKINWVLQESPKGAFSFDEMCAILRELTNSNVYLANARGKIIGSDFAIEEDSSAVFDEAVGAKVFPEEYNIAMMRILETSANLMGEEVLKIFKNDNTTMSKLHTFIPVTGGGRRWGTLVLTRYSPEYSSEEIALAEMGATAVALEIMRRKAIEKEDEERNLETVKMAINTLSYSEHEAVKKIFMELEDDEGILIASKIADKSNITRSVIVNALRKLESAGVIESRSLGMKGTHIRITNEKFGQVVRSQKGVSLMR